MIEVPKQKFKENLLKKFNPLANSTHNTQRKSKKEVSTKSVSDNSKDITIPLETTNQVPSPDTSVNLPAVDYNIVDDIKKVRASIYMFEFTNIMSQRDILL